MPQDLARPSLVRPGREMPGVRVRENCVVLLLPSTNPDGLDEVAQHYMKFVGTPYEGSELDKLFLPN